MKKKNIILTVLALVLVLASVTENAWAYFTTYAEAAGGYPIDLGSKTTIEEEFDSWTKRLVVASAEDSQPVYIRAKAFCGSEYSLIYSSASGKWSLGEDGYYYYSDILYAGGKTDELLIEIKDVPTELLKDGDSFKVVVIYESTPVQYREDGTPYADWTLAVKTEEAEESEEGGAGNE